MQDEQRHPPCIAKAAALGVIAPNVATYYLAGSIPDAQGWVTYSLMASPTYMRHHDGLQEM